VVGNEQEYHFKVLSILLDRLGFPFGKELVHFSYGMVELPNGKMKSREGTVVDADDLMDKMVDDAREISKDKVNTLQGITPAEADEIARKVGLGALKYFMLKVDPRKNMLFNPAESIDFNGNTGPFIQYTHARIRSIMRKAAERGLDCDASTLGGELPMNAKEQRIVKILGQYPAIVAQAGEDLAPSLIANYAYDLAKEFNQYYHDTTVLGETDELVRKVRLVLVDTVSSVLEKASGLLGIVLPDRM
jgi:arginyl-tRNA synthetase